jgi:hypothetical protein
MIDDNMLKRNPPSRERQTTSTLVLCIITKRKWRKQMATEQRIS